MARDSATPGAPETPSQAAAVAATATPLAAASASASASATTTTTASATATTAQASQADTPDGDVQGEAGDLRPEPKPGQICRFFARKGTCKYGEKCRYAHQPGKKAKAEAKAGAKDEPKDEPKDELKDGAKDGTKDGAKDAAGGAGKNAAPKDAPQKASADSTPVKLSRRQARKAAARAAKSPPPGMDRGLWEGMPRALRERVMRQLEAASRGKDRGQQVLIMKRDDVDALVQPPGGIDPTLWCGMPRKLQQRVLKAVAFTAIKKRKKPVAAETSQHAAAAEPEAAGPWSAVAVAARALAAEEKADRQAAAGAARDESAGRGTKTAAAGDKHAGSGSKAASAEEARAPNDLFPETHEWKHGPFHNCGKEVLSISGKGSEYVHIAADPSRFEVAMCVTGGQRGTLIRFFDANTGRERSQLNLGSTGGPMAYDTVTAKLLVLLGSKGQLRACSRKGNKWVLTKARWEIGAELAFCVESLCVSQNKQFGSILFKLDPVRKAVFGFPRYLGFLNGKLIALPDVFETFEDALTLRGTDSVVLCNPSGQVFAREPSSAYRELVLGERPDPHEHVRIAAFPKGLFAVLRLPTDEAPADAEPRVHLLSLKHQAAKDTRERTPAAAVCFTPLQGFPPLVRRIDAICAGFRNRLYVAITHGEETAEGEPEDSLRRSLYCIKGAWGTRKYASILQKMDRTDATPPMSAAAVPKREALRPPPLDSPPASPRLTSRGGAASDMSMDGFETPLSMSALGQGSREARWATLGTMAGVSPHSAPAVREARGGGVDSPSGGGGDANLGEGHYGYLASSFEELFRSSLVATPSPAASPERGPWSSAESSGRAAAASNGFHRKLFSFAPGDTATSGLAGSSYFDAAQETSGLNAFAFPATHHFAGADDTDEDMPRFASPPQRQQLPPQQQQQRQCQQQLEQEQQQRRQGPQPMGRFGAHVMGGANEASVLGMALPDLTDDDALVSTASPLPSPSPSSAVPWASSGSSSPHRH